MSKFGRYQVAEPENALARLHFHDDNLALRPSDHEPKVDVLDQEDLHKQGILCSTFVPGCKTDPDELGSCTAQTAIEALSNLLSPVEFPLFLGQMLKTAQPPTNAYTDTVVAEKAGIVFYNGCTQQTADSATEWPPTDCGSSGPYIEKYACHLGVISTAKLAAGARSIVSLMQRDGCLMGTPFLNDWMDPSSDGFIDGNGSQTTLQRQIRNGVAGGHEIYLSAVEKLVFRSNGSIDLFNTVIRFRNHWTKSWGDNGSARIHLSTIMALRSHIDIRQFVR